LSGALPRLLALWRIGDGLGESGEPRYITPLAWFYREVCARVPGPPEIGSLCYAVTFMGFCWLIGYVLDRKRIYIKV